MITALCVVGTRPEAIKMIPIINALKRTKTINCRVIATAQHREMLDQVFNLFEIHTDIDLNIMQPNQTLNVLTGRMMVALENVISKETPDVLIAQGDTTTVLATALSAFHHKIPFGHVEAGLRTRIRYNPFPEEMNRVLTSRIAQWHFAPTENARQNLLNEGIPTEQIFLTGNTVVDMVHSVINKAVALPFALDDSKRLILLTAHRRENFGAPIKEIYKAIRFIADTNEDIQILYPVHPNPNIAPVADEMLGKHPRIMLCKPLDYITFVNLMKKSYLILSDSGGIQEEALALGKPIILLREQTERPEGVELGGVILAGHQSDVIISSTERLLKDKASYQRAARCVSPYGDGYAGEKIRIILESYFEKLAIPS